MFVYIDTASAVKIFAFCGRLGSVSRAARRASEFGRYKGTKGMSCFIRKSSQVLRMALKLPMQLTMGLVV